MKRLRAKARPRRRYTAYRGRGRLESGGFLLAGVLALIGLVMSLVRSWGMRFSGCLLLGAAALLTADLLFSRWARRSSIGWSCRFAFRAALALVLVPLSILEICIIHEGKKPPAERDAAAVVVLGAGVNGKEPSLSLRTRLDAALTYLEGHPEIPAVLTGGTGYGEEISEARCMYDWLTARGVDPDRLILEEQAEDTSENFALARPLLGEAGVDPARDAVAVVTNDFHMARAKLLAQRQGYGDALGVPAELPWAHLEINYYLREAFAMVKALVFPRVRI